MSCTNEYASRRNGRTSEICQRRADVASLNPDAICCAAGRSLAQRIAGVPINISRRETPVTALDRRDVLRYLAASAALGLLDARHSSLGAEPMIREPARRGASEDPPVRIPFTHFGRNGTVAVTYGVTDDPRVSGFDILPRMRFDVAQCRGYPTMRAVIEQYEGHGYRTICGWIQIVTGVRTGGGKASETQVSVDTLPAMGDVPVPYASMGNLPQMFDAPCHNLNEFDHLHWTADTFLTTLPIRSRDEDIQRLLGFRWGYTEDADAVHHPVARLPFAVTGPDAWNALLPRLRKDYPTWRFAAA